MMLSVDTETLFKFFFLASHPLPLYIPSMSDNKDRKLADVVFPQLPLKALTYKIPQAFQSVIEIGHHVLVSVGRRKESGFVIAFPESTNIDKLKSIEDLLESKPLLPPDLIALGQWTAEYYLATIGEVIRAMLPSVIQRETRLLLKKIKNVDSVTLKLSNKHQRIIEAFHNRDTLSFDVLSRRLRMDGLRCEISRLEKLGILHSHYILDTPFKPKIEKWISIQKMPAETEWRILMKRTPKQAEILKRIIHAGGETTQASLNVRTPILNRLASAGWIEIDERERFRDAYDHISLKHPKTIRLTEHQSSAVQQIIPALRSCKFSPFLLHGVTASGKTQVYIEIVQEALNLQKTALILIPEISLTPQAVQRYRSIFGKDVAVLHSRMSHGERYDSWRKLREGVCRIALGPRSAIFAPLLNLGLIIVDEEHDHSYKQNDPSPRYHARDLAVMRAQINQCTVVLGSATPSLETYYNAKQGKYQLCQLPERIDRVPMPRISLVDRNLVPDEYKKSVLSPLLSQNMQICFEQQEQVILLQNRRGYATYLRCKACGHIESCNNCDITLTYHRTDHKLRCHLCGFQKSAPSVCTKCQGPNLKYRGAGTQKVEEEIHDRFPEIRLLRMDLDTTRTKHAHSHIITSFEKREADVLLGTQMVSKGHDFPGVSLVGIVSADTGLLFPDFRAEERTFQMLIQAAGRSGRRNVQGEVVIQTFYPDHPIFIFVLGQDFNAFFQYAMNHRKTLDYPPFGRLIAIRFRSGNENQAEQASRAIFKSLPKDNTFDILGPVASPISKKKGQFRYQLVLRISRKHDLTGRKLRNLIQTALEEFHSAYHFPDVRIAIDVDPLDML
ncbi:primosomal protein N' [bacterium]|nr:primosomal protein N' [bacterium]